MEYPNRKQYYHNYYLKNKTKRIFQMREYYNNNKVKILAYKKQYNKQYLLKNHLQLQLWGQRYQQQHRKKYKLYHKLYSKIYFKKRYHQDIQFRLTSLLRRRLRLALKNNFIKSSIIELLGCSIEELKIYLESQFKKGMNWQNYGFYGWHIDHKIPFSSVNLTNQEKLKKVCHYTNLQPLWRNDNLKKGSKINL